jgi:hypothetical protein
MWEKLSETRAHHNAFFWMCTPKDTVHGRRDGIPCLFSQEYGIINAGASATYHPHVITSAAGFEERLFREPFDIIHGLASYGQLQMSKNGEQFVPFN